MKGIVAGANAGLKATEKKQLVLDRADAFIGVLIDDLITKGISEPYRMFTSRSEYRLSVRPENADLRLTQVAHQHGLVSDDRLNCLKATLSQLSHTKTILESISLTPHEWISLGIKASEDGVRRTALEMLARSDIAPKNLFRKFPSLIAISQDILDRAAIEAFYEPILRDQKKEIEAYRRDNELSLPEDLDYSTLGFLSAEVRERLGKARPTSLASLKRLEGITPDAIIRLLQFVRSKGDYGKSKVYVDSHVYVQDQ